MSPMRACVIRRGVYAAAARSTASESVAAAESSVGVDLALNVIATF
jgi:hypothetical protein